MEYIPKEVLEFLVAWAIMGIRHDEDRFPFFFQPPKGFFDFFWKRVDVFIEGAVELSEVVCVVFVVVNLVLCVVAELVDMSLSHVSDDFARRRNLSVLYFFEVLNDPGGKHCDVWLKIPRNEIEVGESLSELAEIRQTN